MSTPDFVIQDSAKGRGRPRKDTPPTGAATPTPTPRPKTQATTAEVKQAVRTLESGYSAIALGLMMLGLEQSATLWAEQAETLAKSNEASLTAAPKLAKAIARSGNTGGAGAFILAHALAIAPVIPVVRAELATSVVGRAVAERAARAAQQEASTPSETPAAPSGPTAVPDSDPTRIPGYARPRSA